MRIKYMGDDSDPQGKTCEWRGYAFKKGETTDVDDQDAPLFTAHPYFKGVTGRKAKKAD